MSLEEKPSFLLPRLVDGLETDPSGNPMDSVLCGDLA